MVLRCTLQRQMHCQCYVICGTSLDGIYSLPIDLIGQQHCDMIGHLPFMISVALFC